jgi:hypothetical protein
LRAFVHADKEVPELVSTKVLRLIDIGDLPDSNFDGSDSSVGIATGYGLEDRGSRVRFPVWAENFSLHHRVQNGPGTRPSSYPMGTKGFFTGGKSAEAWSWPLTSI